MYSKIIIGVVAIVVVTLLVSYMFSFHDNPVIESKWQPIGIPHSELSRVPESRVITWSENGSHIERMTVVSTPTGDMMVYNPITIKSFEQ